METTVCTKVILGNELEAVGMEFAPNADARAAFGTLFNGNRWIIFTDLLGTGVLHWDYVIVAVADSTQPIASVFTNFSAVGELGLKWQSKPLIDYESNLSKIVANVNAGDLQSNHMFYTNDYMPLSFHLSSGTTYAHVGSGRRYKDIFAAWDWDLIPGITVDYGNTPLKCSNSGLLAIETFVGSVSDGTMGMAVMQYTNPLTKSFHFQKTWFFLEDNVLHVMISDISSRSHNGSSSGSSKHYNFQTLWHDNVGYKFNFLGKVSLTIELAQKTDD
ncbi:hypothetical protein L208DRAFT_1379292 [Tricholoma matsutake]|nr:hypothetical protein L208DRAFT_1379292 [Tricholoma matsutake 945]